MKTLAPRALARRLPRVLALGAFWLPVSMMAGAVESPQEPRRLPGDVRLQDPAPAPETGRNLAGQLKRVNERLRREVTTLFEAGARSRGISIRQDDLMITSVSSEIAIASAPIQGLRGLAKEGTAAAKNQLEKDKILGLVVVTGVSGKAVNAGANPEAAAKGPDLFPAGVYAIRGDLGPQSRSVQLVGQGNRVYATVEIDPAYRARSNDWWRPIYLGILGQLLPMVG